jgi:hypothetical protein
VQDDTNGMMDVFLYDRTYDTLEMVSVDSSGNQANAWSAAGSVSDGGDVAFVTSADNLVSGDASSYTSDVFVNDFNGGTERIDLAASDVYNQWNGNIDPHISADGDIVAYESWVADTQPFYGAYELVVHDRSIDDSKVVVGDEEGPGHFDLSADGSTITFETNSQLLSADTDTRSDIYVQDLSTDGRQLVSADNWSAYEATSPAISGTGRYVAFQWNDCIFDQPWGCSAYEYEIRVWDDNDNTTSRVSKDPNGNQPVGSFGKPAISTNGRYVTFVSDVETLDPNDSNERADVFIRDRDYGETDIVSKSGSTQGDEESGYSAVANDGSVAFESYASNLVSGDTSWTQDVFLMEP